MNLQPLTAEEVPIRKPLPWPLYDHFGYTLFARGESIPSRRQLKSLMSEGLYRDVDALVQTSTPERVGLEELPPQEIFPPPGIKPQIWERVQLRVLGRETQAQYLAHIIGYIKGRSILVTTPILAGERVNLSDGERLEVSMLIGGNIYVFKTVILRVCISPSHYLHLEYPAQISRQKVRHSPWARTHHPGTVTNAQGRHEIAEIVNLSPEGAQVRVFHSIGQAGDPLHLILNVNVDGLKATLALDAIVQHVRQAEESQVQMPGMLEYGLAFHDVAAQDEIWLRCLVYQRIAGGCLA